MKKMQDLLTVCIPTYNEREDLLRKAIESILNQTYPYIELVLVDDGSTDNTPEVLKEYAKLDSRFKTYRRERDSKFRSVPQAFNVGLEKATGKWWHHDAADCWHEPDWAERCMNALYGRDDVIGAHCDFASHKYDGRIEHVMVERIWKPELSAFENYRRWEALGGMIFRMDKARAAGFFDPRFPRKQTREWTLRVLQQGDLVHVPVELWHFVFHEPDQMKRIASVKYRILVDLKSNYDLMHNMAIGLNTKYGRLAIADAFRDFFTHPEWEKERENSIFAKELAEISHLCDEEASEKWEG